MNLLTTLHSRSAGSLWWERADPYYDIDLFSGRIAPTAPLQTKQPGTRTRRGHATSTVLVDGFESGRVNLILQSDVVRPRACRALGALYAFLHLTRAQLHAFIGESPSTCDRTISQLWKAGLVARTSLCSDGNGRPKHVYALHRGAPLKRFLKRLDPYERARLTTNAPLPSPNVQHLRHNVSVAEYSLRAWEMFKSVDGILGETCSSADRLLGADSGTRMRLDACHLRSDGLRIGIELQGSLSTLATLRKKMQSWGELLAAGAGYRNAPTGSIDRNALVIVFVAANPKDQAATVRRLRQAQRTAFDPERWRIGGQPPRPEQVAVARSSILVADWREWFPYPENVTLEFFTICAHQNLAGETGGWKPVHVAGDNPAYGGVAFNPSTALRSRLAVTQRATPVLHATPLWHARDPGSGGVAEPGPIRRTNRTKL